MSQITERATSLREFFSYLFEHDRGYVCIATTRPPARRDTFGEQFFDWPAAKDELFNYIEKVTPTHNVYFGVNVLSVPRRKKDNTIPQNLLWADLDAARPDQLDIPPQCVIESSHGRYQAIWKLDQKLDPFLAESYCKRLAYHYADLGVDKSGHDLTQLLRVPGTYNYKYATEDPSPVRLVAAIDDTLPVAVFEQLPSPDPSDLIPDIDVPELHTLPSPETIIYRYTNTLQNQGLASTFATYYSTEPSEDWSGKLWRLLLLCFNVGMSREEAFVIAYHSKCNKYERDDRPISHLWREAIKAELEQQSIEIVLSTHAPLAMPQLLSPTEQEHTTPTLIDNYKEWATEATDAVPEFHELCCATLMSIFMSTSLRLRMRHSTLVPNLWALILGESTLTRKTTAMDMAMDFVHDIDKDLILASDASPEGMMNALSGRPKRVSIFYRDEVTGFFSKMVGREYMSDMPETLTKLYDVPKFLAKRLKKDTYVVAEPIFVFFGGGVPEKMNFLIDDNWFASGFIPRFLVLRGRATTERIKPQGPPEEQDTDRRSGLLSTFYALHEMYTKQETSILLPDGQYMSQPAEFDVTFTDEMWNRAARIEMDLMHAAEDSAEAARALPMFSRMYTSLLKLTMLFCAARQEPTPDFKLVASMNDLYNATYYIQKWGVHAIDLVMNAGLDQDEGKLMSVMRTIEAHPGIMRGDIMSWHKLDARKMTLIQDTLMQRHMITTDRKGRGTQMWPIGRT